MKKIFIKIILFALVVTVSSTSFAGLIGVSQIKITSTNNVWLQIAEVLSIETGTGDNLALTAADATASSSGNHSNHGSGHSEEIFAIDGITSGDWYNNEIYHSDSSSNAWFLITLATPSELNSISLFGRTDCCSTRDIYNIELFDVQGSSLFTAYDLNANNNDHFVSINLPDTSSPVPEPTSLALLGLGLAGFGFSRKKKKS